MRYLLAETSHVFSTRDRGARVLEEVRALVGDALASQVVIDFADVQRVSYSFIDEFLGVWASELTDLRQPLPELDHVSEQAAALIAESMKRRGIADLRFRVAA